MAEWNRRELGRMLVAATALAQRSAGAASPMDLFRNPPNAAKMVMYYWWFGPSQTTENVNRELDAMRDAGIGGTFIFPCYPLSASDNENYPYLSDRFLRVLRTTVERSRQNSMTVDILTGSGWPFGGPSIEFERSSRTLRKAASGEALREGEHLIATDAKTGALYVSSPTRQRIKGAGIGSEGWVLDHLNLVEVRKYLDAVCSKLVEAAGPDGLRSINFDSLEAFQQFWTPSFPEEFRKRRGYDLIPHLPALWDATSEEAIHVRYDYWKTLTDLFLDGFVRPFHAWCKQHGVALQGKPMGAPLNDLRAFAEIDLAVAEEYDWLEFGGPRWAASGAHIYGQNIIANEGYTWLRQPRYLDTLQDIKIGSDIQFLAGINSIIAHGFSYSPDDTDIPGWSYYASVFFHPKNTFWPYFKHVAEYVQRVSYILREGVQVADVALFLPEDDVMASSAAGELNRSQKVMVKARLATPGDKLPQFGLQTAVANRSPLVSTMVTNGYNFDGINNEGLQKARIEKGRLRVGQGDYGVVVLPRITGMPVESMEKLAAFAKAGGKVIAIGAAPSLCYGLQRSQENSARVRAVAAELFGAGGGKTVADDGPELLKALREAHPPDIDFEHADREVGFIHRRTSSHDYYFLANTSNTPKSLKGTFRISRGRPEVWDPMTGATNAVAEYSHESRGTKMDLILGPYASTILTFPKNGGASRRRARKASLPSLAIGGKWTLEVNGKTFPFDTLESWTKHEALRYYSGPGTYRIAFELEKPYTDSRREVWLSLGAVHEIADVALNGRSVGVAWMAPYQLDVSGKLREGSNELVIKVTNLLINRVLGQPRPDTSALLEKFGKQMAQEGTRQDLKFQQNFEKDVVKEPVLSGLFGPVQLIS